MLWLLSISYVISIIVFVIFSLIAINHAARFRYLSPRTVYLTMLYTGFSSTVVALSLIALIALIVW